MDAILSLLSKTLLQVWVTFTHNWPFLVVSIVIAVALKLFVDQNKVAAFLVRHQRAGVIGATAAAVGTPLCSCGTTAVILGMMASTLPWAPIVAFMVASPLTSPEELVYSAGLFGWPFAITFFIASILLGLFGGLVANLFDKRGWLKNQTRYKASIAAAPAGSRAVESRIPQLPMALSNVRPPSRKYTLEAAAGGSMAAPLALTVEAPACGCASIEPVVLQPAGACSCDSPASTRVKPTQARVTPQIFLKETFETSRHLVPMFIGFAFIGYLLNNLIPAAWVSTVFGQGNVYSVPLAATLGLPLYINSEASLPLIRALIDGGMSQGAALAFLITGAGTSIGAITGMLTIARWRVIALVVGILWIGAITMGYLYNVLLATGLV